MDATGWLRALRGPGPFFVDVCFTAPARSYAVRPRDRKLPAEIARGARDPTTRRAARRRKLASLRSSRENARVTPTSSSSSAISNTDYSGPERRRRVTYMTRNTEYHLEGGVCVAVRDRA